MCSSEKMTTKTKMLSTDSDSSSKYAAKYSVAALLPCVAATHSPSASPSPTHTMTHAMFRDEGASAVVLMCASLLQSTGTKSEAGQKRRSPWIESKKSCVEISVTRVALPLSQTREIDQGLMRAARFGSLASAWRAELRVVAAAVHDPGLSLVPQRDVDDFPQSL